MSTILQGLLAAGFIEKLEGDDSRYEKIEQAAKRLSGELKTNPSHLIRAILAGLDPDIAADDPFLLRAEEALKNEWKAMRSVHPDSPVGILRAILLGPVKNWGAASTPIFYG